MHKQRSLAEMGVCVGMQQVKGDIIGVKTICASVIEREASALEMFVWEFWTEMKETKKAGK